MDSYQILEFKLTSESPLTKGQTKALKHVKDGNGMFEVRSRVPNLGIKPGDEINVTEYIIKYKYIE